MKLHKIIAKAFGYELIKRKKDPTVGSHLMNLINHYEIDLILDVGANQGQFGSMLRAEGYIKDIHSFEPVTTTFNILKKASRTDANWYNYKLALGDHCGEETINISGSSDLSSFLSSNSFGKEKFKKIQVNQTEKVTISTVHHFLTEHIPGFEKKRILLKMDTQGYDFKVFQGAKEHLSQIRCILCELPFIPIYSEMDHYLSALKNYEEHNYKVTGLYPVSRNEDLTIIEMDCFLVNTAAGY